MGVNPILYAVPVFFGLIFLEIWIARRRGHLVYRLNDALGSLALGILSQVSGALTKFATLGIYVLVYSYFAIYTVPMDSILAWVLALIGYDFCYYWLHRMGHEVNVLWAAHGVHHSSEEYNLTTALRQTSSGFLFGWIFYLPLAIIGIPPVMFVVVGLIDLLYQFWIHTREVDRLGWFDKVFASPSNHRVHHGQNDYCIDRNYGGLLMIWDHMFGTYVDERADEPIIYGIRGALRSFDPIEANLVVYRKLWQASRKIEGWPARVKIWLQSPSMPLDSNPVAFEPQAFRRFDPPASTVRNAVGFAEFMVLYALSLHYSATVEHMDLVWRLVEGALIAAKGFSMAMIFNRDPRYGLSAMAWAVVASLSVAIAQPDYGFALWLILAWGLVAPLILKYADRAAPDLASA